MVCFIESNVWNQYDYRHHYVINPRQNNQTDWEWKEIYFASRRSNGLRVVQMSMWVLNVNTYTGSVPVQANMWNDSIIIIGIKRVIYNTELCEWWTISGSFHNNNKNSPHQKNSRICICIYVSITNHFSINIHDEILGNSNSFIYLLLFFLA